MDYTKEFWKLPKIERMNELKSRMNSRSALDIKFNEQRQIGLKKSEISNSIQKLRTQKNSLVCFEP